MTVQFAVSFSSLLVEYENFVALNELRNNLTNNLSTAYSRSTYSDVTIIVYQKYFVELYCCTVLYILDVVNEQLLASLCLKLLAINLYNCVHFI